jgi:hypothetical protein
MYVSTLTAVSTISRAVIANVVQNKISLKESAPESTIKSLFDDLEGCIRLLTAQLPMEILTYA